MRHPPQPGRSTAIGGISHTIVLDAALWQRDPDAKTNQALPQQPRWHWLARACLLKHGVPGALLIEADCGYALLVSHRADTAFEFGGHLDEALRMALDIHPDVCPPPHDALFSVDPHPKAIRRHVGTPLPREASTDEEGTRTGPRARGASAARALGRLHQTLHGP